MISNRTKSQLHQRLGQPQLSRGFPPPVTCQSAKELQTLLLP